jgi:hypothetical protein
MRTARSVVQVIAGLGLVAAASADAAMRYSPEQIRAGQPFVYALYVDVFQRLPLLVAWVAVVGVVWAVQRVRGQTSAAAGVMFALATVAVVIFALISPIVALLNGSNTVHLTDASVGSVRYSLYVEPSLAQGCYVVLVRCEGLLCRYVTSFFQPVCLGRRSPYRLTTEADTLIVWYAADEVAQIGIGSKTEQAPE